MIQLHTNHLRFGAIYELFLWHREEQEHRKLVTQPEQVDKWVRQFNDTHPDAKVYRVERGTQTGNQCAMGGIVYVDNEGNPDLTRLQTAGMVFALGGDPTQADLQKALQTARTNNANKDEYINPPQPDSGVRFDQVA